MVIVVYDLAQLTSGDKDTTATGELNRLEIYTHQDATLVCTPLCMTT